MRKFLALIVFTALIVSPVWAAGSGAYRTEVPDAAVLGKGAAFVGEANTVAAVYYNPAGLTQLVKDSISTGVCLIKPAIAYQGATGDEWQAKQDSFYVPSFFYATKLGTEKIALGIGATSNWGLATEWAQNSALRYNATRSVLINKDYMMTAAYQATDKVSVAVGLDIDMSEISKEKKLAQVGDTDGNVKLKGDDSGAGFRVSTLYKLNDRHQFGLMYRSEIQHKYTGKIYLDHLSSVGQASLGGFSYQQVFGGTGYETAIEAKNTLPQSVIAGYSFRPDDKWVFNFDLEWMDWASTDEELITYPEETNATRLAVLNNGNPTARDWRSSLSTGVGAQYSVSDRLRLRSGYYFHDSPIPSSSVDAPLPDSDSHSFTMGFGYDILKSTTLDMAYSAIFYREREIDNDVASALGGIDGNYNQTTQLLQATVTYSF